MRWMNLEPIIQSEVSQKDKYHISTYIYGLQKDGTNNTMQGSKGDTGIKNRLLDSVGEGEGGTICKNNTETYTLSYVKQIASGTLMYDVGHPRPVLCDDLEEWGEEGNGGGVSVKMQIFMWFIFLYGRKEN